MCAQCFETGHLYMGAIRILVWIVSSLYTCGRTGPNTVRSSSLHVTIQFHSPISRGTCIPLFALFPTLPCVPPKTEGWVTCCTVTYDLLLYSLSICPCAVPGTGSRLMTGLLAQPREVSGAHPCKEHGVSLHSGNSLFRTVLHCKGERLVSPIHCD